MSNEPYAIAGEMSVSRVGAMPAMAFDEPMRPRIAMVTVFMVFWVVWMGMLGWVRWHHPELVHGDPTTDANILNGGDNFAREGLRASWGVPAIDTYRGEGKTPDYYTTYPPGAYWFHHAVRSMGVQSLSGFRVVSLAVSGLSVLVLFGLLRRLCRDAAPAVMACVLYMTSKPFVEYADALHYLSLSQLTVLASVYAWVRYEEAVEEGLRASAGMWLAGACAAYFLDSWLTFEHALFVPAVAGLRAVWLRRWPRLLGAAMLLGIPAMVLAMRVMMNRAVLGSFEAVFKVMRGKFDQRIGSSSGGTGLEALVRAWLPRLGEGWRSGRVPMDHPDAEFGVPLLSPIALAPLAALVMLAIASWHLPRFAPMRRLMGAAALLLIGGLTWFGFMTEHAISHRFTVMLILPGIAAVVGMLVATGFSQPELHEQAVRSEASGRARPIVRVVGPVLAIGVMVAWCGQLASSFAVNLVARGDRQVREAITRRGEAARGFSGAGEGLREVRQLFMLGYDAPAARALGRPFDNTPAMRGGEVPATLSAGQALLAPLWSEQARAACVRAVRTFGLPDRVSATIEPYLVFRGSGEDETSLATEVESTSGLRVTRMEWRRALDERGWVLVVMAEGKLDQLGANGARLVVRGQGERGQWKELAGASVPGSGCREGDRVLLSVGVRDEAVGGVGATELRLVSNARPKRSPWRGVGERPGVLPAGVTISDGALRWMTPPWAKNRAAGAKPEPEAVER